LTNGDVKRSSQEVETSTTGIIDHCATPKKRVEPGNRGRLRWCQRIISAKFHRYTV